MTIKCESCGHEWGRRANSALVTFCDQCRAPKHFVENGTPYMEVTPGRPLMHSKLISEVVNGGRRFVVDLNTGHLTIKSRAAPKIKYTPYACSITGLVRIKLSGDFNEDIQRVWKLDKEVKGLNLVFEPDGRTSHRCLSLPYQRTWGAFRDRMRAMYDEYC
jgi:hypothetical protein